MCSFLIYFLAQCQNADINIINRKLKLRGPDKTNIVDINGYKFIHNLLHITGTMTLQPFIDNNIVALFNGEIYNYKELEQKTGKEYQSDGCCIIPSYLKYGRDFVKKLDGDFALALFDFTNNIVILSSDVFATKPIWYGTKDGKLYASTFKTPLKDLGIHEPQKIKANETLIFDLTTGLIIEKKDVYTFDLNQHKTTYDDWINAFELGIKKRTEHLQYPLFICLSSGYDSGVIACVLNKLGIKYYTYTVMGIENADIMNQRFRNKKNKKI